MLAPIDRAFPTTQRGQLRDLLMQTFRVGLRERINPKTKATFTETEIQVATAELGRFWNEADALDLVALMGCQQGLWLVDQLFPLTSSDWWLDNFWGPMVGLPRLNASSGGGEIDWTANAGTTFIGSTTRPDPSAHTLTIGAVRYQVLFTETTGSSGVCRLRIRALETGPATNAKVGAKATGANYPAGAQQEGIVIVADFIGGAVLETSADYGRRILDAIRYKPAAGNPPQVREWARKATVRVEDAFIYSCAMESGTVRVAVTQKRDGAVGPLARIADALVVDDVRAYLVPPGSPVFPVPPIVVVTGTEPVYQDVMARLTMPKRSSAGYTDANPWPKCVATRATITVVTNQQSFRITRADAAALDLGVTPSLMVWHRSTSRFEKLAVTSVVSAGGLLYDVVLSQAPQTTIAVNDTICPDIGLREPIALGAEAYFDELGPGQLLPDTDSLFYKAERFPFEDESRPSQVGSLILSYIREAAGGSIIGETLVSPTIATPAVAADPANPPNQLVFGQFGVYPQ